MLTPLSQYIIEYTKLKGESGTSHMCGIPNFRDFKDPQSFLALLDKIRGENLKLIEKFEREKEQNAQLKDQDARLRDQNVQLKDQNARLREALAKFDPNHPLLKVEPGESKTSADVGGDSPFILRQYGLQTASVPATPVVAASPAASPTTSAASASQTVPVVSAISAVPAAPAATSGLKVTVSKSSKAASVKTLSVKATKASELTRFV